MKTSAGTSYIAPQSKLRGGHEAEARIVLSVAEHDDALYASRGAAGESLADQATPDALLLIARRNRHWRQADQRRLVGVLDGHRGEQDVPDDRCADLRDQREDDCVRAVQASTMSASSRPPNACSLARARRPGRRLLGSQRRHDALMERTGRACVPRRTWNIRTSGQVSPARSWAIPPVPTRTCRSGGPPPASKWLLHWPARRPAAARRISATPAAMSSAPATAPSVPPVRGTSRLLPIPWTTSSWVPAAALSAPMKIVRTGTIIAKSPFSRLAMAR